MTKLAAQAADQYIRYQTLAPLPQMLPQSFLQQRACYVSILEKPGRHFRAMYGRPLPQQSSLAAEVVHNTIAAIQNNNSGRLFRVADLAYLSFSVAVLGPLERITNKQHLSPAQYGLYMKSDRDKTAIILPQRTGIDTPDDQIATAIRESGIEPRDEAIVMYRFFVEYYE